MVRRLGGLVCWVLLLGLVCGCSDDSVYIRPFNSPNDRIDVAVTDQDPGPDAELELTSSSGLNTVGTVIISPGSGPVGTEHDVLVEVLSEFASQVVRVVLYTESTDRGNQEHELRNDSVERGQWTLGVISQGSEGETRTDSFRFELWELTVKDDPDAIKWERD